MASTALEISSSNDTAPDKHLPLTSIEHKPLSKADVTSFFSALRHSVINFEEFPDDIKAILLKMLGIVQANFERRLIIGAESIPILGFFVAVAHLCRGDRDRALAAVVRCTSTSVVAISTIVGCCTLGLPGGALAYAASKKVGDYILDSGAGLIQDAEVRLSLPEDNVVTYFEEITSDGYVNVVHSTVQKARSATTLKNVGLAQLCKVMGQCKAAAMGTETGMMVQILALEIERATLESQKQKISDSITSLLALTDPVADTTTQEEVEKLWQDYDILHAESLALGNAMSSLRKKDSRNGEADLGAHANPTDVPGPGEKT